MKQRDERRGGQTRETFWGGVFPKPFWIASLVLVLGVVVALCLAEFTSVVTDLGFPTQPFTPDDIAACEWYTQVLFWVGFVWVNAAFVVSFVIGIFIILRSITFDPKGKAS